MLPPPPVMITFPPITSCSVQRALGDLVENGTALHKHVVHDPHPRTGGNRADTGDPQRPIDARLHVPAMARYAAEVRQRAGIRGCRREQRAEHQTEDQRAWSKPSHSCAPSGCSRSYKLRRETVPLLVIGCPG